MAVSPYVAALRESVGTTLLLLPTVAVLARDEAGRVLLVRQKESGQWSTVGGMVEPDEAPEDTAQREAEEEAAVTIRVRRLVTALGGPEYRITYANGDQAACVPIVYEATVHSGTPQADGDETSEVAWFDLEEVLDLDLNELNRHLLTAVLPLLEP